MGNESGNDGDEVTCERGVKSSLFGSQTHGP